MTITDIKGKVVRRISSNKNKGYHENYWDLRTYSQRNIDDENLIVSKSFGVCIPGNKKISKFEKEKRINFFHEPYHKGLLNSNLHLYAYLDKIRRTPY